MKTNELTTKYEWTKALNEHKCLNEQNVEWTKKRNERKTMNEHKQLNEQQHINE